MLREALDSSQMLNGRGDRNADAVAVEQVQAQLRLMTDSLMRVQGEVSSCAVSASRACLFLSVSAIVVKLVGMGTVVSHCL